MHFLVALIRIIHLRIVFGWCTSVECVVMWPIVSQIESLSFAHYRIPFSVQRSAFLAEVDTGETVLKLAFKLSNFEQLQFWSKYGR